MFPLNISESPEVKTNIQSLMQFVEKYDITMISGFPYLFADMNRLEEIPHSLRLLISGGDVLRASYVDHLLDQADVYNTYLNYISAEDIHVYSIDEVFMDVTSYLSTYLKVSILSPTHFARIAAT